MDEKYTKCTAMKNAVQFVLYRTVNGLIKQTLNRNSRCDKVDAVRLYALYRCIFTFTKGAEVRDEFKTLKEIKDNFLIVI